MLVSVQILDTSLHSSWGTPYCYAGVIDVNSIESIRHCSFRGYPNASRVRMKSGEYLFLADDVEKVMAALPAMKPTEEDDERRREEMHQQIRETLEQLAAKDNE